MADCHCCLRLSALVLRGPNVLRSNPRIEPKPPAKKCLVERQLTSVLTVAVTVAQLGSQPQGPADLVNGMNICALYR